MLRMILLAVTALPLAACGQTGATSNDRPPVRIVCTDNGQVVVDDFATHDVDHSAGGVMLWNSATQNSAMRTVGNCTSYQTKRDASWTPVIPGLAPQG